MSEQNLVTTCLFHNQDFLVKMNVANSYLELSIADKQSGEEWQCSYDGACRKGRGNARSNGDSSVSFADIENLTRKTGNFKQFDIFTTMLKSGFLKTSECISLDLLTYEDLESLRIRRIKSHTSRTMLSKEKCNRRYLILIYNVEFDRILYPLPLEYCGPPDPSVLQATIRKLEMELGKIKAEKRPSSNNEPSLWILQKRIDELEMENSELRDEVRFLGRKGKGKNKVSMLQSAISHLERSVLVERKSHHTLVEKLRREKVQLVREVEVLRNSERNLKLKLSQSNYKSPIRTKPRNELKFGRGDDFRNMYRNCSPTKTTSPRRAKSEGCASRNVKSKKSRDSSASSCKYSDYDQRKSSMIRSRSTSLDSNSSRNGHVSEILKLKVKNSEDEFRSLETRISTLQRMLRDNINIF